MLPSLFISHGSPMIALMNDKITQGIKSISQMIEKPKYIIVVSAHWESSELEILADENPNQIYDFYGFPRELYELGYEIKNNLSLIDKVVDKLNKDGLHVKKDFQRQGYDHGVWVPLSLMYKTLDIPVLQLSLPHNASVEYLLNLGKSLKSFRDEALIIGSGSMTHNLRDISWDENALVKTYAKEFHDWMVAKLESGDIKSLKEFQNLAPSFRANHPTSEHILPLFVALGASTNNKGIALLDEYMYSNQSMENILFE